MGNYDLLLLEGAGSARGINSDGVVVGSALASDGAPYAAWWSPRLIGTQQIYSQPQTVGPAGGEFYSINDDGDAVGVFNGLIVYSVSTRELLADLESTLPISLEYPFCDNNSSELVGTVGTDNESKGFIYNWKNKETTWLNPPLGQRSVTAMAIDSNGDVAGGVSSADGTNQGFLYTAGQWLFADRCILFDVNDKKLAVGGILIYNEPTPPMYVDFSQSDPQVQQIPLLFEPVPGWCVALAVNSGGTIIGLATEAPDDTIYPFVYQVGQVGAATNLNDLVQLPAGVVLVDAWDINDAGQIVGYAFNADGVYFPYVATPIPATPLPPSTLTQCEIIAAEARVLIGHAGTTTSALEIAQTIKSLKACVHDYPRSPEAPGWDSLIKTLEGLPEYPTKPDGWPQPPGFTPAQKAQMAEARKRMLNRLIRRKG